MTKLPEFATVADKVAYLTALKGARLVQPFGSLHGKTPRVTGLLRCSTCECAPRWWNYMGLVDGGHDNMEVAGLSADGDRPPPELVE